MSDQLAPKQVAYAKQAASIIKELEKRNMKGHYFNSSDEAKEFVNSLIKDNSTVTWGGSMTIQDMALPKLLKERNLTVLDRADAKSGEEVGQIYRQAFSADYYLMSTNAITLDGKLINIDGNGNRVAALIFGPQKVIVVAGMNKVALDEAAGILRVQNFATPANAIRLNQNTPCAATGKCHDCQSDACLCCETVITRRSRTADRIEVILVGEDLGY